VNYGRHSITPPNKIIISSGLFLLVIGTPFAFAKTPWFDLIGMWVVPCTLAALLVLQDYGYLLMWDEDQIVMQLDMRVWRWINPRPLTAIRICNIMRIRTDYGQMTKLQLRFIPFDHIVLEGPTEGPEPHVMIMPNFMHVESARDALRFLYERRPEVFEEEVITFMNSEKRW
jgi:hypothetical protein